MVHVSCNQVCGRWQNFPGDQINPTMNGGGRSVLIWGQTCITMLGDKGKPLSGYKVTRIYEHGQKIWQGRMARVQTNVYTFEFDRSAFGRAVSSKLMILSEEKNKVCLRAIGLLFLVVQ